MITGHPEHPIGGSHYSLRTYTVGPYTIERGNGLATVLPERKVRSYSETGAINAYLDAFAKWFNRGEGRITARAYLYLSVHEVWS